ncbi:MAG TPA: RNA 2',3'-cyclic phosphodiesterase [Candidatus Polarisedimenticolia bacterium]|nr:RNA 2',3'-cyclic phosphodiesterase [Candidatus Polarisedimenticolia bacterium]
MRLFVAAPLPTEIHRRLAEIQEALRPLAPARVSWVRPEGIHLTLKFIGEVGEERLPEIKTALDGAHKGVSPFLLEARNVQCEGRPPEEPRLIWILVQGSREALERLQGDIERVLERVGFPRESRRFKPHLTLGRVKARGRADWGPLMERAAGADAGEFIVAEYGLYQSRLAPEGATYATLERYPLTPEGRP